MQIIQKKLQLSLSACSQICLGSNLHDSASNITITKIIYKNNCALADQSLICQRTLSNVDRCKNNVIYMSSMVQWWSTWNQSWWSEFTPARSPFVCSYRQDLPSLSSYRQDSPSFELVSARFAKFWVLTGKCANPRSLRMNPSSESDLSVKGFLRDQIWAQRISLPCNCLLFNYLLTQTSPHPPDVAVEVKSKKTEGAGSTIR
jgi:hypothetical protein